MHRHLSRRGLLGAALAPLLGGCDRSPGGRAPLPEIPAPQPSTTVTAATGLVAVPGEPLRVVVLDTAELDSAMTLGITPAGACRVAADPDPGGYWDAGRLAKTAAVGIVGDPDLDRIRELRPQLILGNQTRDGARYDALRAIAPTVLTATTGYPWRENFLLHARALGRQSAADAVVAANRTQLAQTGRAIGGAARAGGGSAWSGSSRTAGSGSTAGRTSSAPCSPTCRSTGRTHRTSTGSTSRSPRTSSPGPTATS